MDSIDNFNHQMKKKLVFKQTYNEIDVTFFQSHSSDIWSFFKMAHHRLCVISETNLSDLN